MTGTSTAGCKNCDPRQEALYNARQAAEWAAVDAKSYLPKLAKPDCGWEVRFYETLHTPDPLAVRTAWGLLLALRGAGVEAPTDCGGVLKYRCHQRRQSGAECGWEVLHYVEEEARQFRREGRFSFAPPDWALRVNGLRDWLRV